MPHKGLFISIEGIDGCGKTTLIEKLASALKDIDKQVLLTKEPGGSALGKQLREILQQQPEKLDGKAEFLLFAADRAQHFTTIIMPALDDGKIVITDRCSDSSLAYQSYGHFVDRNMIQQINQWSMQNTTPDIVFYLRIDVHTASQRIAKTRKVLTTFEQETIDFWQRVIQGYEEIFAQRTNVCVLDARMSAEDVFTQAWNHLSNYLSNG